MKRFNSEMLYRAGLYLAFVGSLVCGFLGIFAGQPAVAGLSLLLAYHYAFGQEGFVK